MRVSPCAKAETAASIGYSSIIDGARSAGTRTPFKAGGADANIGDRLAALLTLVQKRDVAAHLLKCRVEPGARRIDQYAFDRDVGARNDERRGCEERRRGRVARNQDIAPGEFASPLTVMWVAPSLLFGSDSSAEVAQHALGMIARRLALDHRRFARRMQPGDQHRAFDLRRRHRQSVDDRHEIAGAAQRQRQRLLAGLKDLQPHLHQWRQHAPHRPPRQRRIARHLNRDRMAGDDAHHQPRAGAGIAEIERALRLAKTARSAAFDLPDVPDLCRRQLPARTTARAVLMTSSASSRPRMRVVPVASAPKISARCEIDLSPGTRSRPRSGGARIADIGFAFEAFKKSQSRAAPRAESPVRQGQSSAIQALAARLCQRHRAVQRQGGLDAGGEGTLFDFDRQHCLWQTGSLILRIIRGSI